ncbi:WD40-repeat-containing domain [Pseudocohnilembus persalinus]|uniref:WD40-repeat-containing domain n=1 Tax=Pseudocohnilembus persalinus TaxID=266149 RepID=A0A0V0QWM2_PSEPJ|nr:WD40-repeat-containing domain [Pseudocohnilembus persalinus]|eukprot:KRX06577.1 WD40-repeat-containing domain [Pseudocohnilembus persalinus]
MQNSNLKVGSPLMPKMNSNFNFESPMSNNKFKSPGLVLNKKQSDRFIPNKVSTQLYDLFMNEDIVSDKKADKETTKDEQNQIQYQNLLQQNILGNIPTENNQQQKLASATPMKQKKLLRFQSEKKSMQENMYPHSNGLSPFQLQNQSNFHIQQEKQVRKIGKNPNKILDAPGLQDDYYLNLIDWSSQNYIGVGLENCVYVWSACNSKVSRLCELPENDSVSSVSWSQSGNHLAVGNSFGDTMIYDIGKQKLIRTFEGHNSRIGSLAWNGYLIASGSRDRNILVRDVRAPTESVQKYQGHKQEICGLRWSFDENILASGGNDNKLFLWSLKHGGELTRFSQHTAGVKALGFSPHQHNILASGGGTADRCIRFWNTHTLQQIDYIDTGSQVCNLMFSKNVNEIVSTHGYSLNQIIVWKYPSLQKQATLTGHTYRVLYLAMSPDGQQIVTGAGDETLRFWNVFPSNKNKNNDTFSSNLCISNMDIR